MGHGPWATVHGPRASSNHYSLVNPTTSTISCNFYRLQINFPTQRHPENSTRMSWGCGLLIISLCLNSLGMQLLYISTSSWVLRTPISDQNMLFQSFCAKKLKKGRKSKKFAAKFGKKVCTRLLVGGFIPRTTLNEHSFANSKPPFFAKF